MRELRSAQGEAGDAGRVDTARRDQQERKAKPGLVYQDSEVEERVLLRTKAAPARRHGHCQAAAAVGLAVVDNRTLKMLCSRMVCAERLKPSGQLQQDAQRCSQFALLFDVQRRARWGGSGPRAGV